ncbi:MAG: hypothetical protein OMM_09214, partial [Candidatus Magnetoglobus multicellularis str. Araruama]
MADSINTDSDPYVDVDPDLKSSVEVVDSKDSDDQVSLIKIFILLIIFVVIISGGLGGFYYFFYHTPTEMVADNWHAPIITPTESVPQAVPDSPMQLVVTPPDSITVSVSNQSLTLAGKDYSLTAYASNNTQPSLTSNISNTQVSLTDLTMQASSSQAALTDLTLNNLSIESALTETQNIVRKTITNPLAPLTPNLRSTPVLYRYKIAGDMETLTSAAGSDEIAADTAEQLTDTTDKKSETADSITETEKKKKPEVAEVPLRKRRKPIVFRATIPLILMYPELTLNFNSFILLLPDVQSKTYIEISVSLKTSNEKVFKEIQDR